MTLVGDVAQTSDLAGARSWAEVLEPYVGGRFRLEELTVNYRNPAELMAVAAGVLAALDPPMHPAAVGAGDRREAVDGPVRRPTRCRTLVKAEQDGGRRRPGRRDRAGGEGGRGARRSLGVGGRSRPRPSRWSCSPSGRPRAWSSTPCWSSTRPASWPSRPRGTNDLYVALTRSTQRLGVLPDGPLPAMLSTLDEPVAEAS